MKLLLDENLPKQLLKDFPEHEVYTIQQKGWNGKTNGELLEVDD
jgi:predicted nuclease of predicted toxin-antitoxin system